ncbi:DUF3870 domain-containing protein [Sporomusa acidovorans]|uniref:DUF3870 domain-containing protein n=1 Tax=Sporomusa acidovorans (strain ATCC 49682 / DSM 3132 / Mol) TaxID=1123286 RepID=A0ABZ3J2P3_SPOA4|nr:DUF3870 domain-containing protein [Sporomusa acidovorans]OZC20150.1 hypothetical protein SPACI_25480 [Sporomusa acidovorans DSM 3132]SDD43713.1 protein of unknown function [Sporomusa acidovorans]
MGDKGKRILFSGYAKLPTGITASEIYKVIGVVLSIDEDTGNIVEADCTLATAVARKHVSSILVGNSITDPDHLVRIVDKTYQGSAKRAIITAIRIIYDKYRSYKDGLAPSLIE